MSGLGNFRDLTTQCGDPTAVSALSNAVTSTNGSILAETKVHTQHNSINPMEANPMLQHPSHNVRMMPTPLLQNPMGNAPNATNMIMQRSHMTNLQHQQAQMMMDQMFEEFQDKLQIHNNNNNNNSSQQQQQQQPKSQQMMMHSHHPQMYGPPRNPMYGGLFPQQQYMNPMMMMPSSYMHPSMMSLPQQQQQYIQQNQTQIDNTNTEQLEEKIQNEEKEKEGISTNGTEEMKDDATVQNELDSLDPSNRDMEAIERLLHNTEDEHMQNSQFFSLLRQLASKKQYNDASFDAEQLAREWEQHQMMDEVAEFDPTNAWKDPFATPYVFQTENPYLETKENEKVENSIEKEQESSELEKSKDDKDYMAEGLRLMKEGNLSEAILAFEACVKKEPNRSEAWRYLGQCHADNENEKNAIAAYLKCYELDPYDLDALLALGVSYTNENDLFRAIKFLKEWIMSHPEFSVLSQEEDVEEQLRAWGPQVEKTLISLFLKALKINEQDPDLHAVLGVLHNITRDYETAELHFKRALQKRPNDPSLWNKLGATQANGGKCQLAINAYSKALELKPNYVRSLSNLGISFSNLKMHHEACQTYLTSLRLNPKADVWDNLEMALMGLGRSDLLKLAEKRDISLFKNHFDF